MEKTDNVNRKDCSLRLDEALWESRATFKTPIGMSLHRPVFGKAFHLPLKLEHKAYWALKKLNLNFQGTKEQRLLQLHALEELYNEAHESA